MLTESLTLGIVQGVTEWLPISSTGALYAIQINIFGEKDFIENVSLALYLHLGTFLAALIYFWRDVVRILRVPLRFNRTSKDDQCVFFFLLVSTLVSAVLGLALLSFAQETFQRASPRLDTLNIVLGVLLLITALLQFTSGRIQERRTYRNLITADGLLLGLLQAVAVVPGISRSGITMAGLLLRKVGRVETLKLSFLMSLPITLGGNVALQVSGAVFGLHELVGLAASFVFGLLTIHSLLHLARRVNFGWFALGIGLLLIAAGLFLEPPPL